MSRLAWFLGCCCCFLVVVHSGWQRNYKLSTGNGDYQIDSLRRAGEVIEVFVGFDLVPFSDPTPSLFS